MTTFAKLGFYGAAQNVTGSQYLLEACGKKILIDCGLYQERGLKNRNWEPFQVNPGEIDAVVLTHAHLDHCGLLPRLVKQGFNGPIYATKATVDIVQIVLLDSAKINEEDAEFKRKRHEKEGRVGPHPVVPLYPVDEAMAVKPLLSPCEFHQPFQLASGLTVEFVGAAHILGAAFLKFTVTIGNETRTIIFSGDMGRHDMPILKDPSPIGQADYVVCESTYGDRTHGPQEDIPTQLATIINETARRKGNIIIPSFAIERTQELIYFLAQLLKEDEIPHLRTFVDSPMAIRVTDVFKRHQYLFDKETTALVRKMRLPGLTMVRTQAESKTINHIKGSAIIIAGSGMCTGGRIKHHLVHNIEDRDNTILFVGYQAEGTLGRQILDGNRKVRILGQYFNVRARIERITGFSAHADKDELTTWLATNNTKPRHVFVTHGEINAANAFAEQVINTFGCPTSVPEFKHVAELD